MHRKCIGLLVLLLGFAFSSVAQNNKTNISTWYSILLEGTPVGWAHMELIANPKGYLSRSEMTMSIRRGLVTLTIKAAEEFQETEKGEPIFARSTTKMGISETTQEFKFEKDGIRLSSGQGTSKQEKVIPLPKEKWLTPAAASRFVEAELAKGATNISYKTIQPANGPGVIELKMVKLGEENVEVLGKVVPAIAWEQTMSIMPGMKLKGYVDSQGRDLKTDILAIPGMKMSMVAADEQLAKAKVNPPEIMAATLVPAKEPIPNPRQLKKATFVLKSKQTDAPPISLPESRYQKVIESAKGQTRVQVDLDAATVSASKPDASHLASSAALNYEDPKVAELVTRALKKDSSDSLSKKAETLRRFVRDFVNKKDLAVGFATASEVARTSQGDCTEHAVLLAALLRGAGIPSRTVSGIVYVDEFLGKEKVFGYHMWTQAWLDGAWVDLDAALGDQPFDATHIALATSAMAEESMMNDLMKMVPLLGQLDIEKVD